MFPQTPSPITHTDISAYRNTLDIFNEKFVFFLCFTNDLFPEIESTKDYKYDYQIASSPKLIQSPSCLPHAPPYTHTMDSGFMVLTVRHEP